MTTLLMTSVSSLVGQEWLDSLQDRRKDLLLLGTGSSADSPRNYRCDHFFLFPPTAEREAFSARLRQVLEQWQPDLILAGRDEDALALAEFAAACPEWQARIPGGPPELLEICLDKRRTQAFAQAHGLPWARSWWPGAEQELADFLADNPWPLIAKPARGYASRGVYLLQQLGEVQQLLAEHADYLLQEGLGLWSGLPRQLPGIPLSFQLPECRQYNAQTVIGPQGEFHLPFCDQTLMILGRSEAAVAVDHPGLEQAALDWCSALARAGARGCVNIQFLPDQTGQMKAFEVNLRLAGGTHGRRLMGWDEMAWMLGLWCRQRGYLPPVEAPRPRGRVYKSLTAEWLEDALVEDTLQHGRYSAPQAFL